MERFKIWVVLYLCIFTSGSVSAAVDHEKLSKTIERFTVRIDVLAGHLFSPVVSKEWQGSGFIVRLSEREGLIFTNRHVLESKDHFHALNIKVSFPTGDAQPEIVQGDVFFISPTCDFGVIKFDPRKLKRARRWVRAARVATSKDYEELLQTGREVLAFGHPLGSANISTRGQISGIDIDSEMEDEPTRLIQIDAAINPGSSGGPLVDVRSGKVIGINSAGDQAASSVGWALPASIINAEFAHFLRDPNYASPRRVLAHFYKYPEKVLKLDGSRELIEKEIPGFFRQYSALLMVPFADSASGLLNYDVVLRVDGKVIGDDRYALLMQVQKSKKEKVRFTVLRQGKVINVDVAVSEEPKINSVASDFVIVSGLVMRELKPSEAWTQPSFKGVEEESKVVVDTIIPSAINGRYFKGKQLSVISEILFADRRYKIIHLSDARKALDEATKMKQGIIRLIYRIPLTDENGEVIPDPTTGRPIYSQIPAPAILPITGYFTSDDIRIEAFRKGYDFTGMLPDTTEWRNWLTPACRRRVMAQAAEVGGHEEDSGELE